MKLKKKNTGKKLNEICIIAFILSVFSWLGMNLVPTFTNYNHLV